MDQQPNQAELRYCENCGRPFELDKTGEAPHKRFCSAVCRNQWHYQQRKTKLKQQRQTTETETQKDQPNGDRRE